MMNVRWWKGTCVLVALMHDILDPHKLVSGSSGDANLIRGIGRYHATIIRRYGSSTAIVAELVSSSLYCEGDFAYPLLPVVDKMQACLLRAQPRRSEMARHDVHYLHEDCIRIWSLLELRLE